jgi:RpiR family transcriptional regulator, carbohydrate utilization regulator
VAISHSGESQPVLNAVRLARERGVHVIALTNFPSSSLTKLADVVLLTAVFQEHLHGEVVAKRVAQLCLLESLYVNYLMRKGPPVQARHDASYTAMRMNKR